MGNDTKKCKHIKPNISNCKLDMLTGHYDDDDDGDDDDDNDDDDDDDDDDNDDDGRVLHIPALLVID